ncbi:MAG TPA: UDP-3-O-acyl-N-acetylglucosamine deacetylase, partial [Candidatus Obscuribacterales bacterium]
MQPLPDAFAELDFTHDWTLAGSLEFTGHGVHTGAATRLILHPATSAGLILRHQGQEIPIQVSDVRDTRFCTTISGVMTLEHVLAALNGLGISAAVIEVAGPEAPILDGSAGPIVAAVLAAGIMPLASQRRIYRLTRPWRWQHGEIRIDAEPARQLEITYAIDFQRSESRLRQELRFVWSPAAFAADIAPARTFAFAADVEAMRAQGLVRGG